MYIGAQKKVYHYYFIKQKCQVQTSIEQDKYVATTLKTRGINATHQHFQIMCIPNFVLAQGAQKLSAIKF